MKEFTIEIEIDEDAEIKAETKGTTGEICVSELNNILKNIDGDTGYKNKPEFYQKDNRLKNRLKNNGI